MYVIKPLMLDVETCKDVRVCEHVCMRACLLFACLHETINVCIDSDCNLDNEIGQLVSSLPTRSN